MDHFATTATTAGTTGGNPNRAEAERLLGIAEKLLQTRDLTGSREFALLAQETEPLLEGSDQILAITDVLLSSERRVNNNRHYDWYGILQTDPRATASEPDLLKKNYRRLALLLHPDKNKFPLADSAFKLVADAWAFLTDPAKRTPYDQEISLFAKVDLRHHPQQEKDKLPVRKSPRGGGVAVDNAAAQPSHLRRPSFWTACPYCYLLYEYPRVYMECCLKCQNCNRAFHASPVPSLPPVVPGKDAYYCCWGFFPLGFTLDSSETNNGKKVGGTGTTTTTNNDGDNNVYNVNNVNNNTSNNPNSNSGFPNWMPGMFTPPMAAAPQPQGVGINMNMNMNMNNMPNVNASTGGGGGPGGSGGGIDMSDGSASAGLGNMSAAGFSNAPPRMGVPGQKKRGRPRKNPLPA